MPWVPELFTAPALQQLLDKRRRDELLAVPYLDGFLPGGTDALVESLPGEPNAPGDASGGEPMVHDPVRGRVKGVPAFRAFATEMHDWLLRRNVSVEDVDYV